MKKSRKTVLTLLVVTAMLLVVFIAPAQSRLGTSYTGDALKHLIIDTNNVYPLVLANDRETDTEVMSRVHAWATELKSTSTVLADSNVNEGYDWRNTFSFDNSETYFEGQVFTEEEVHDNMRNSIFRLLYGDIEAACQISILDVMLLQALDSIIVEAIGIEFMGYCNGFSQAARDYFLEPHTIPLGRPDAYSCPAPNPNNLTLSIQTGGAFMKSAILEYVLWKGSGAFFNPNHLLNWVETFLGLDLMSDGTYNALAFQDMAQWMLAGPLYEPVVILLTGRAWEMSNPGDSHFVLAYDYETHSNGSIQIYVYNNHDIYTGPEDMYSDWIMLAPDGTFRGLKRAQDKEWHIMCAYERSPEYNSILSALIELLPKALQLLVLSPVNIQVTDPAGRRIGVDEDGNRLTEFPAIYTEGEDGHKTILMPYVPGVPYTVNLTGTGEGDYTLQTTRVVDGKIVTQEVQGQTTLGETDVFSLAVEGDGINLAKQGVRLFAPSILSGTAVELQWTKYDEPDFDHYEIFVSESAFDIGRRLDVELDRIEETSYQVTGLTPENTYFFTVRVNTTSGLHADSNRVGAVMPKDITSQLLIAAGVGGAVVFLIVLVLWRRRRS